MLLDKQNVFDWQAALTATRASTDVIDLVNARDLGGSFVDNPNLKIRMTVVTALVSAGSSTLAVAFQGSTDNSNWDTYLTMPTVAKASLVAGYTLDIPWPDRLSGQSLPQYIRLNYTVDTTDFTGGTVSAYVVLDRQKNFAYRQAVNVQN